MTVLVTGATGFVGSRLVPALLDDGHDVRVLVRDRTGYDGPDGVEVVEGDVLHVGQFEEAFEGVTTAYYLIHSMKAGADFEARDRQAARNVARAASEAGIETLVYLGGLGEEGDELSDHLQSRREVEEILAAGTYDLVTLRAAIIVGDGSAGFEMVRQLIRRLPVMTTPRWVRNECQPIAISDVIQYLRDARSLPPGTYEIGGPDVLTYAEMLRRTATVSGKRAPIIVPLPLLTPQLSSYWVGLVTNVDWRVARPLIDGLANPVIVRDDRITGYIDIELTPFDEAVERALAEHRTTDTAGRRTDEQVK